VLALDVDGLTTLGFFRYASVAERAQAGTHERNFAFAGQEH
jgi:hypothetical protein